ncbi:MAG: glycosyltransferase family 4 protein [Opitutaceae bacterium]|nr:glycosyltransferase family 4 protein [Cytophagales bacterium]
MKRILVSAYAVNPYKGSEDGTGWNLVCQIARFQKAIVITRKNNREAIEKYMNEVSLPFESNLEFQYYDLPYWMRFWKRKEKGALLYFYLWQLFMPVFIKRNQIQFDIAHNLNFHNNWTPTFLWRTGKPLVWGPIGHHAKIPMTFLKVYGWSAIIKDRATWIVKLLFWKLDPFLRMSYEKASLILAVSSAEKIVHKNFKEKMRIMPAVAASTAKIAIDSHKGFNVLMVGRFVALKGFDVAIRAFEKFRSAQPAAMRSEIKLILVGKGPEKERLQDIVFATWIAHSIKWIDWVDKAEMESIYQNADVFLFPSHEGAGMVVPEALSFGLPVFCFDNYGPGELTDDKCAIRIPYGSYDKAIQDFADALTKVHDNRHLREEMSAEAFQKWERELTWDAKGLFLRDIYNEVSLKNAFPKPADDDKKQYQLSTANSSLIESEF